MAMGLATSGQKTCKRGHVLDVANTYASGNRKCRICHRAANKRWKLNHPEKAKALDQQSHQRWLAKHGERARALKNASSKRWRERYPEKRRAIFKRWSEKNRERRNELQRLWSRTPKGQEYQRRVHQLQRVRQYGLTQQEFESLWNKQLGLCVLCLRGLKRDRSTHIDHDHSTSKVRGLLCRFCNQRLGMFHDDIELLNRAIEYIARGRA